MMYYCGGVERVGRGGGGDGSGRGGGGAPFGRNLTEDCESHQVDGNRHKPFTAVLTFGGG